MLSTEDEASPEHAPRAYFSWASKHPPLHNLAYSDWPAIGFLAFLLHANLEIPTDPCRFTYGMCTEITTSLPTPHFLEDFIDELQADLSASKGALVDLHGLPCL